MEFIGKINHREIFYISIRDNSESFSMLPTEKWVAFTIADKEDKEMLNEGIVEILNKNVTYTCSAGELSGLTEQYFDNEIVLRTIEYEEKTGNEFDYNKVLMTTMHENFSEGFWFSAVVANDGENDINKVVCVDFTTRKVKHYLIELIDKINNDWLPNDDEFETPKYDNQKGKAIKKNTYN